MRTCFCWQGMTKSPLALDVYKRQGWLSAVCLFSPKTLCHLIGTIANVPIACHVPNFCSITEVECPFCGSKTSKVHSIYQREIQDLPMQGKKVILLVDTRKMRCMNPGCSHKTFSEKHPFVAAKSKKTNRLIQNIIYTSSQLSSLKASKLLKSENISVCKSSICDLLKKNAIHCG